MEIGFHSPFAPTVSEDGMQWQVGPSQVEEGEPLGKLPATMAGFPVGWHSLHQMYKIRTASPAVRILVYSRACSPRTMPTLRAFTVGTIVTGVVAAVR